MRKNRFSKFLLGTIAYCACANVAFSQAWHDGHSGAAEAQPPYAQAAVEPANLETQVRELSLQIEQLRSEMGRRANVAKPSSGFSAPKIGGRFFFDSVNVMNQNGDSRALYDGGDNLFRVREARITATGTGYGFLDYKMELGFENGDDIAIRDMFLGISNVPYLEYVRVGNQYVEDAGSEIANGTTNYTFMEAPAPAGNQFTSRRVGISSRHLFDRDRGRLFVGLFEARDVSSGGHQRRDDNHGVVFNTRYTHAPMFQQEGRCMFLYGAYYSYNTASEQTFTAHPGGWNVYENPLNFTMNLDSSHKAGFEIVYQNDRFAFQTDLFVKHYNDIVGAGDATNYGGFVMARYFLTPGDFRKYNLQNAMWSDVRVCRPFVTFTRGGWNCVQGPGAWEVAAMYGFYDADFMTGVAPGAGITDIEGIDQQLGLALNWHWNSQVRWSMNYIHQITDADGRGKAKADLLGLSCRVVF